MLPAAPAPRRPAIPSPPRSPCPLLALRLPPPLLAEGAVLSLALESPPANVCALPAPPGTGPGARRGRSAADGGRHCFSALARCVSEWEKCPGAGLEPPPRPPPPPRPRIYHPLRPGGAAAALLRKAGTCFQIASRLSRVFGQRGLKSGIFCPRRVNTQSPAAQTISGLSVEECSS